MRKTFLVLLVLSACSKPYKAKEVALSDSFLTQAADLDYKRFNPRYWELLDDPTLSRLVERVEEGNFTYLAAREKINQMRAAYSLEKSKLFPKIDGSGFSVRSRNSRTSTFFSNPNGPAYGNLYGIGFDSSWELDLFGAQLAAKQNAFFNVMSETEKAAYLKLSLISECVMRYISLRTSQSLRGLYEKQINLLGDLKALEDSRFLGGLEDKTPSLSVLSRLDEKKALYEQSDSDVKSLIFSITKLTSQFPDAEYKQLLEIQELKSKIPLVYPDIPSELVLNRPDVKQARFSLFAAQAAVKKAVRDFFPKFSLTSLYGFVSNYASQLLRAKSIQWDVIPAFNVNIIDFGALVSAKNSAKSQEKQALYNYEQSLIVAFSELETALAGIKASDLQIASIQEQLAALDEKSKDVNERFRVGLIDKSKYLEALLETLAIQESLVQAIQSRYSFAVSFYKALGVCP